MGDFKPLRQAFLEMLKDRLDTLPQGCNVTVAVTVHGMPWDYFKMLCVRMSLQTLFGIPRVSIFPLIEHIRML